MQKSQRRSYLRDPRNHHVRFVRFQGLMREVTRSWICHVSQPLSATWWCGWGDDVVDMMAWRLTMAFRPSLGSLLPKLRLLWWLSLQLFSRGQKSRSQDGSIESWGSTQTLPPSGVWTTGTTTRQASCHWHVEPLNLIQYLDLGGFWIGYFFCKVILRTKGPGNPRCQLLPISTKEV